MRSPPSPLRATPDALRCGDGEEGTIPEATTIGIAVHCEWRRLYERLWRPEAFALWASGLSEGSLVRDGDAWTARGSEGPIRIRFTPHNSFGIMDHWVHVDAAGVVYVPLRIVENGEGALVMLTLFRQPGTSAQGFAADEAWVRRDLQRLKALAEG